MTAFAANLEISIHALREEGDRSRHYYGEQYRISIHALREEGDRSGRLQFRGVSYFYPRPPRGGRQPRDQRELLEPVISIHALREEGDSLVFDCCQILHISIHALREEGDPRAQAGT